MGKNQWVSPCGDKWGVHGEGNSRDTKQFERKSDERITDGRRLDVYYFCR